eukprot:2647855-Rhodomonas_salina.1
MLSEYRTASSARYAHRRMRLSAYRAPHRRIRYPSTVQHTLAQYRSVRAHAHSPLRYRPTHTHTARYATALRTRTFANLEIDP